MKYPEIIKKGQRWIYKSSSGSSVLIEVEETVALPNNYVRCRAIQSFPGFQWTLRSDEWSFNLCYSNNWTYLEGQDAE